MTVLEIFSDALKCKKYSKYHYLKNVGELEKEEPKVERRSKSLFKYFENKNILIHFPQGSSLNLTHNFILNHSIFPFAEL